MNFELPEEIRTLREMVSDFVANEITPYADQWDEEHYYPRDLIKKMGELGFFGCLISEEYGGNEMGFLAQTVLTEELARGSSSLRVAVNCNSAGTAFEILHQGTEEAKKKYIPKLMTGEYLGAFAITEPNAGSDTMAMKSTAEDKGDYFLLNGAKTWISNAQVADVAIVYAYHDRSLKSKGLSAFILDCKQDGVTTTALDKMGTRSSPTGEIIMENAKVPKENLLGNLGDGVKIMFTSLNQTRMFTAAGAIGVAQACLDVATQYLTEREQFGKQVGQFQMNQDLIAQMAVELEAARLLTYKAAWQKDQGMINNTKETSYAKYFSGLVAQKASHSAMKILGAYGYSTEYPVARLYRDAVLYQIVEGTENIQKWIIALDQLGYRKANK
jgi:glutaryl-CoA dehydrogenase (non-decarboxylating)